MKLKVSFGSPRVWRQYAYTIALLSAIASFYFIVVEVPPAEHRKYIVAATTLLILVYVGIWLRANFKRTVKLSINNSSLIIKTGDVFQEDGLKAIAFNEYFDTEVDERIISKSSLNGQYITRLYPNNVHDLDSRIVADTHLKDVKADTNSQRRNGKKVKYNLGSVFLDGDYLLVAFSRFDESNRAELTLKEYVSCMLNFWDEVDKIYANRSVTVPLMGAGITRFKDADVQPQELLSILIWTFKISRVKFKHPANATIIIHDSISDKINFFELGN